MLWDDVKVSADVSKYAVIFKAVEVDASLRVDNGNLARERWNLRQSFSGEVGGGHNNGGFYCRSLLP